ncbi:MAG: hypothetical protein K2J78_06400 [Muribaculaceae bacterium]|nr:hypothetical protein [Muribaculaceae bacterium]MDE6769337.1 hypothetical protein [Muribaculaceae bacterium]
MKLMKSTMAFAAVAAIALMATGCKGRTTDNVVTSGDTIEVNIGEVAAEVPDSMNHDAEVVTLPDSIEVPE